MRSPSSSTGMVRPNPQNGGIDIGRMLEGEKPVRSRYAGTGARGNSSVARRPPPLRFSNRMWPP